MMVAANRQEERLEIVVYWVQDFSCVGWSLQEMEESMVVH